MKADSHKVRVNFRHGNAMSLDLRGCGSIYIEPGKDYFFENAPMQFINYLAQLRRLGITYRLTSDKKGCYMTIDLTGYLTNEPKTILGNLRSNLVSNPPKITRPSPLKETAVDDSTIPDLIPNGTFKEEVKTVDLTTNFDAPVDPINDLPETELEGEVLTTNEVVTTATEPVVETNSAKEEEYTAEKIDALNKTDLINLAQSLGIPNVSEIWTKKELRTAIKEKLSL